LQRVAEVWLGRLRPGVCQPRACRGEHGLCIVVCSKRVRQPGAVLHQRLHREVHVPARCAELIREDAGPLDLVGDFGCAEGPGAAVVGPAGVQPGVEVSAAWVVREPPPQEAGERLVGLVDRPVELGHEVVAPPLVEPAAGVGVDPCVLVEALDVRGVAGAIDAKRADADLDVGLDGVDLLVELLDEGVDVVPPPVVARERAAFVAVALVGRVVGEGEGVAGVVVDGVGVEVVVEVDAVDVVAGGDVGDDGE